MDILVHVSSPATIHHDKQYLALAQAIIDFQPLTVTRVESCADSGNNEAPLRQAGADSVTEASLGDGQRGNSRNALKRPRPISTSNPNPPYRNPFHPDRKTLVTADLTPLVRPRTATEPSPSTVQVPRTDSAIRRAFSDPLQSTISRITDSQECLSPEVSSDGRISSPLGPKGDIVISLSQTSIGSQPPSKRARLRNSLSRSPTAARLPGECRKALLRNPSLDLWSSPPRPAASEGAAHSDTSTATPSQPLQAFGTGYAILSQNTPNKPPSIVSLSSGPTQHPFGDPQSFEQEQMPTQRGEEQMDDGEDSSSLFPAIDSLPVEATAPQPNVGDGKFSSHVTQHLQELFDRPQLYRLFRPLRVTRDVKVLERGHWLMEITIADDEVVRRARSSPTKEITAQAYSDRFTGATAEERLARFWQTKAAGNMTDYDYGHEDQAVGQWTEAEFLTFWDQFSTFIGRGRAGWAVRMVRDGIAVSHPAAALRKLRVRIFTWGEVIGHIYLAIWVCSGKMATRIPMKWVAGDGSVVVEMSGKKKLTGNLPPWVRKGPPGEGGSWGVTDD